MPKLTTDSFYLQCGRILARKYEVIDLLGSGWEGEVYLVREISTGIERTAKFFFPERNKNNKNINFYANKLHKLRHCPIVIHYNAQETITLRGQSVSFLISEYVEGELLSSFVNSFIKLLGRLNCIFSKYLYLDSLSIISHLY